MPYALCPMPGLGMYESFYGLRENPFNVTPDPQYIYLGENQKEALAHLLYGVRTKKGFNMKFRFQDLRIWQQAIDIANDLFSLDQLCRQITNFQKALI